MADNTFVSFMQLLCLYYLILFGFFYQETIKLGLCEEQLNDGCIEGERKTLVQFKEGLTDPSGRLSFWTGKDCCKWRGVECHNITGHVIKLNLRNPYQFSILNEYWDVEEAEIVAYNKSCLGGKITSLLGLKHLNYLDLSMNNFQGLSIPKFIGSLDKLIYLNLSHASFAGTIPPHLGNLSSLHYLDLYAYSYSSRVLIKLNVDNLNWFSGLTSLKYLNMGHVNLSKVATGAWLKAFNMLPSLLELHLAHCQLDNLPLTLPFVNFTSLSVLDLSYNDFNSSIPQWLFNVSSSLVNLDLCDSFLQGSIPYGFANMILLQELDLSFNFNIDGRIPRALGNLCNLKNLDLSFTAIIGEIIDFVDHFSLCTMNSLEMLDLSRAKLGGHLPESLGYLENLRILRLSGNLFQGSIPTSIGNLSSLEELDLSFNQMNGSIPESIGKLSELVVLYLRENSWDGIVTEAHFCNSTRLKQLVISLASPNNSFVFNVKYGWIPPFRLDRIFMANFNLGPRFPAWLKTQKELKWIGFQNVGISDTIPDWLWESSSQIKILDLPNNQIKGRVPKSLAFGYKARIYLDSNCFEGEIPLWSNVSSLSLKNNLFSGHIPPEIGNVMWPTLTQLDLSGNSLNGSVPSSIGILKSLEVLVLSKNHLFGEIPRFWRDLPQLRYVDLSHNSLSGSIPSSIGYLCQLKVLQLSNNDLYGEMPSTLKNCIVLRTLDLGKNRLSGNISSWIGDRLSTLSILQLGFNLFNGSIPPQLCHLSYLHILDLGHNNLSGFIPSCMDNLTGFSDLSPSIGVVASVDEVVVKGREFQYSNTPSRFHLSSLDIFSHKSDFASKLYELEGYVDVAVKGREFEYSNTLSLVKSVDLSSNSLSGKIPEEITSLSGLGTLNLSMNHLTGEIPEKIGSLKWLETLDLSRNQLTGLIPSSISSLTSLNHFKLSYNNLSGRIPSGKQLQTLNDSSIYEGNSELCGPPLASKCPDDETSHDPSFVHVEKEDGNRSETLWFYITIGLGFAMGFWGVCGTLILKRSWRHAYFHFLNDMKDWILVIVAVKAARFRRRMKLERNQGYPG